MLHLILEFSYNTNALKIIETSEKYTMAMEILLRGCVLTRILKKCKVK